MADTHLWFHATLQQMKAEYITAEDLRIMLHMSPHRFVDYLRTNRQKLPLVWICSDGKLFSYSRFSNDEMELFLNNTELEEVIGKIATHEIAIHRNDILEHKKAISGGTTSPAGEPANEAQEETSPAQPSADTPALTEKQRSIIAVWEDWMQQNKLSPADKKAVKAQVEEVRGKRHREIYPLVCPGTHVKSPVQAVSKMLKRAKALAQKHHFPLP